MVSRVWYATVYVRDFARAMDFYENTLGLKLRFRDDKFGHGSFATEGALFSVKRVEGEKASMAGRQTGIGFGVADLGAEHRRLSGGDGCSRSTVMVHPRAVDGHASATMCEIGG
jgi:catechol 2,3-dioxygenase-like lactoylglutathione lyase family enzyme